MGLGKDAVSSCYARGSFQPFLSSFCFDFLHNISMSFQRKGGSFVLLLFFSIENRMKTH